MHTYLPLNFELKLKNTSFREGTGISNLDGRLWDEVGAQTACFFGDEALVRARIGIEARYIIALSEIKIIRKLTTIEIKTLLTLHEKITPKVYLKLRKIESHARHDVITMTLIMKSLLKNSGKLIDIIDHGWIHWGLSSEDIDNLARTVLIRNFLDEVYLPQAARTLGEIVNLSQKTKNTVTPGKTHLQTAIPTILGKEIALFGIRLGEYFEKIKSIQLRGKLTGAVGNLSAHKSAYPKTNWRKFSQDFVRGLGLEPNLFTTQTEPKTKLVELFQLIQNVNSVLLDLSQDMRIYIGFDWLIQEAKSEEFGSSAMPQKVNPIDFENSQGNALLSNWILEGLVRQFPVSWLQRDLVDKTIFRNIGLPFGYSLISLISTNKGLSRVKENKEKIKNELESDWGALSEAFQINLRAMGLGGAYETLKKLSRGKKLGREEIKNWVIDLKTTSEIKNKLLQISFENYTGYASENALEMIKEIKRTIRILIVASK
jgi:adenylosuccinate lyase